MPTSHQKKYANDVKFDCDVEFTKDPVGLNASASVVSVTNFGGVLTSSETDVQKALDKLDDHTHSGSGDVTKDALAGGSTITTIGSGEYLAVTKPGSPNVIEKILYSDYDKHVINLIYFVGICIPVNATTDPNTLYNWQTWVLQEGVFLAGYKSGDTEFGTLGGTGGAKTFDNYHRHTQPQNVPSLGPGSAGTVDQGYTGYAGSATQSILPPYKVVKWWERTA